jgi:NitT/TauT family transport system substrate-binding protein
MGDRMKKTIRGIIGAASVGAALVLGSLPASAQTLTPVKFMLPAPALLPAWIVHNIALSKGYFKAEGLDVSFVVGQGGADAATQIGAGNADIGGGLGDTPIVVRPNGVPIKGVVLLGGGGMMFLFIREDAGIADVQQVRGKSIGVMSYQDTSYYTLLGMLAKYGLTKNDVNAQAVGAGGIVQLTVSGQTPVMVGPPDFGVPVEAQGVKLKWLPLKEHFPSMAQGLVASDKTVADKPRLIQGVTNGMLKALDYTMKNPDKALDDYIAAVPQNAPRKAQYASVIKAYNTYIWPGQKKLGEFDPATMKAAQDFYVKEGIVRRAVPVNELYTNQFVNAAKY